MRFQIGNKKYMIFENNFMNNIEAVDNIHWYNDYQFRILCMYVTDTWHVNGADVDPHEMADSHIDYNANHATMIHVYTC